MKKKKKVYDGLIVQLAVAVDVLCAFNFEHTVGYLCILR